MAKYDPLRDHLAERTSTEEVTLSFAEVEELVGGLPGSAHTHTSFWSNDSKVQAKAWRAAGWHVEATNMTGQSVMFARGEVGGTLAARIANGSHVPKPLTTKERIEAMPAICPKCFTAVPSTLVCDYCG
ncbi:hypothetical protein BH18ACT9_BH18ACT9_20210 [soil metagenome]